LLGCMGCIVGIVIMFLSTIVLYNAVYDEYGPIDPDGDYIIDNFGQELPVGTWVIENPYYFVQESATVKELENWRQTRLVISEDGSFELIQPPELLAKLLLVSGLELNNNEPLDVSAKDMENVHRAMDSSIVGQWSKQTDDTNMNYYYFQTGENNIQQCVHNISVKKKSIRTGRLEEGSRLHWSLCSQLILVQGSAWKSFPKMKDGIVWKKLNP